MIRFLLPLASPRRFPSGRGVVLGAGGALMLSILGGCNTKVPIGADMSGGAARPISPLKPTVRPQSLNAALAKIDGATVQAWFNRLAAPAKPVTGRTVRPTKPAEIEVLTRAHPAWQLADALERGTISPSDPQVQRFTLSALQPLPISPGQTLPLAGSLTARLLTARLLTARPLSGTSRPARTVSASGEGSATRQRAALDRFFAAAQKRDALRSQGEAFLARRSLDESISAARRDAVSELDLTLVPPDVAAQLTNLRLELVRSLAKTPAEREAARAQIAVIENRYAQIWSDETARQAEKIRQLSVEVPAQKGREGAAQIARETQTSLRIRAEDRREVAARLAQTLRSDIARRNDALTLVLPAAASPSPGLLPPPGVLNVQKNKTSPADLSSVRSLDDTPRPLASTRRFNAALVAQLRNQARRDAQSVAR